MATTGASCTTAVRPGPVTTVPEPAGSRPIAVRVRVDERGAGTRIRTLHLEEYVAGCVDAELGRLDIAPASAARMRNVQAVLCRTYALGNLGRHAAEGFDLCASTHCQLFRQLPPESLTARLATQAVMETAGLILAYNGRPIQALYHASCGGKTSRADAVWGGRAEPYLTSVTDAICATAPGWRSSVSLDQLRKALGSDKRTTTGDRLDRITVATRDDAGRVVSLALSGTLSRTVSGETFRMVVSQSLGAQTLRSTWFSVRRDGGDFVFEGRGSGHGAGLCQAGAIAQAKAGRSAPAILAYYFPGTQLISFSDRR